MSSGLDHPLVHAYLAGLERALSALPPDEAAELRDQIAAHLDDALPAGADDEQITAVLTELGQPAELAAEAGAPSDHATGGGVDGVRAYRRRLRRRILPPAVSALLLVAAWVSYVVAMHNVTELAVRGSAAWWYPADSSRQVVTRAAGELQTTVRIRSGQQQGFVVEVYNPSDLTQTVLGTDGANWVGSPGATFAQLAVSAQRVAGGAIGLRSAHYRLVADIPPHQSRAIRMLWISTECTAAGETVEYELTLKVRIGWITRTEILHLNPAWALAGPSTGKYAVTSPLC